MKFSGLWCLCLSVVLGGSVWAQSTPVYVSVGERKVVKVSIPVSAVRSSEPSTLSVKKLQSREIQIEGEQQGRATLLMKTLGGNELTIDIHVVSPGSRVYSALR